MKKETRETTDIIISMDEIMSLLENNELLPKNNPNFKRIILKDKEIGSTWEFKFQYEIIVK